MIPIVFILEIIAQRKFASIRYFIFDSVNLIQLIY